MISTGAGFAFEPARAFRSKCYERPMIFKRPPASTETRLRTEVRHTAGRGKWDVVFLSTMFDADATAVKGFVYYAGKSRWADVGAPALAVLFAELRAGHRDERGPCDGCTYRLVRGVGAPEITFLWGGEAEQWRITPATGREIHDRAARFE
jgi:hypothetical protein